MTTATKPVPLPPQRGRFLNVQLLADDATLVSEALHLVADRVEGTAIRLRALAPELRKRAVRIRSIADAIGRQAEGAC